MMEILIRYIHFIGIMTLSATLVAEHLLLSKKISFGKLKSIIKIDIFYLISAALILITGLIQWFFVGKPAAFFNTNMIFHIKFTLFIIIVILSLFPTRFFIIKKKQAKDVVRIPNSIFRTIRIELILLVLIPLLAVLMAKGFG